MIVLTDKQQESVNKIKQFLEDPEEQFFTLEGVGGSGKTSSVVFSVKDIIGKKIIGGTISHAAKFVLEKSLSEAKIPCYTVAQLLELTQVINEKTGEISFKPAKNVNYSYASPLMTADIIIIDECSMLSKELHESIKKKKRKSAKVIYLGDPFQLCPIDVEQKDSVTFGYTKSKLHEAIRYTGPIADLGDRIRKEIEKFNEGGSCSPFVINEWQTNDLNNTCRTSVVNEDGSGYIFINDLDVIMDIAAKAFKENSDPNAMRLIAFRNATIAKLNDYIRTLIYEEEAEDLDQFMPGELVICDGGYAVKKLITAANYKQKASRPCIHNNEVFKINGLIKVEKGPEEIPSVIPILEPEVKLQEGERIFSLDNELGLDLYNEKLSQLKKAAIANPKQWVNYYSFKENFAVFNYNYSCSVHKSQGSTFLDAIVFEKDILSVSKIDTKIKLQSLYVACTRAKRRVYIYNSKYQVDNTNLPSWLRTELGI